MIYNGKEASIKMQGRLRERIRALSHTPALAIFSVGSNPATASFIKIKKRYAEAIGINIEEFNFPHEENESGLIAAITSPQDVDGIIVQLPLPSSYNTRAVLDAIPESLDVDVLGSAAEEAFGKAGTPIPPVASAVIHILEDTDTSLSNKNVVIVGCGKLVGIPVATWFVHQGITPRIIDINTDEDTKRKLLKEADIVVTGVGNPKMLKPEYFRQGVILIDAGTSEQGGVLSGDCDPACADVAGVFTPVPGGVGPLTVAYLYENVLTSAEKR